MNKPGIDSFETNYLGDMAFRQPQGKAYLLITKSHNRRYRAE